MSAVVKAVGEYNQTDEYLAAERLKKIILQSLDIRIIGKINIYKGSIKIYSNETVKNEKKINVSKKEYICKKEVVYRLTQRYVSGLI